MSPPVRLSELVVHVYDASTAAFSTGVQVVHASASAALFLKYPAAHSPIWLSVAPVQVYCVPDRAKSTGVQQSSASVLDGVGQSSAQHSSVLLVASSVVQVSSTHATELMVT